MERERELYGLFGYFYTALPNLKYKINYSLSFRQSLEPTVVIHKRHESRRIKATEIALKYVVLLYSSQFSGDHRV